jgi:MerR family transcriptional regulator/heat shock protein HspR
MREQRADDALFPISAVAELLACHPQTLRMYERLELVRPTRAPGNSRLYSAEDIERIRRIQSYTAAGVNLAGVEIIFRLLERIDAMERRLHLREEALRREVEEELLARLRSRLRGQGQESHE